MSATRATLAVLVGRSAAMCVHPYAAWRSHSVRIRLLVVGAYLALGFVVVFGALWSS
jgi:hypothetical protein